MTMRTKPMDTTAKYTDDCSRRDGDWNPHQAHQKSQGRLSTKQPDEEEYNRNRGEDLWMMFW